MELFQNLPDSTAKKIDVVFCDIDDTISTEGKLLPEAYSSLWKLKRNGIKVVPITGRCAGWVDHIARMWPVEGVVGENGAFYAYMDTSSKPPKLKKRYFLKPEEVKEAQKKFENIKEEVFSLFPSVSVASDQPYRDFDLAIDFCEDVPPLPRDDVLKIVEIYEKYGANTKISSIHVNGWFGEYDKLTMTKIFSNEQLNLDLEKSEVNALFIGDSPNDQPMFKFFSVSVGVANVNNYVDLIEDLPTFITEKKSGLGFAEMVDILIRKRNES